MKKFGFPYRTVEAWNVFDGKVIEATTQYFRIENFWDSRDDPT